MTDNKFIQKKVLGNGMAVLVHEMPWAKTVSLRLIVKAGPRFETNQTGGCAHYLEHLLFDGSQKYPSKKDIHESIERKGGLSGAFTAKEYTCYYAKIIDQEVDFVFEYIEDIVFHPLMNETEFQKEKGVIAAERRMRHDDPNIHRWEMLDKFAWGDHPIAAEIVGSLESIETMRLADLTAYWERFYDPSNCIAVVAGNITAAEAISKTEAAFGGLKTKHQALDPINVPVLARRSLRTSTEHRQLEDIKLLLAFSTKGRGSGSNDIRKLQLISGIIGHELFYKLVDKLGIAYSIGNWVWGVSDNALLAQAIDLNLSNLDTALDEVINKLNTLRITPDMLGDAKTRQKASLALNLADSDDLAAFIGDQELFMGSVMSPDEFLDDIDSVRLDELKKLYGELVADDNAVMVLLGPIAKERAPELDKKLHFKTVYSV